MTYGGKMENYLVQMQAARRLLAEFEDYARSQGAVIDGDTISIVSFQVPKLDAWWTSRVRDVPRTSNGWPTIPPCDFTDEQLVAEHDRWKSSTYPGSVGDAERKKYLDEMTRRGL